MAASATELEQKSAPNSSQAADILDFTDDEGWEDIEPDEEQVRIISLLDDEIFPDVASMLAHCQKRHKFDFLQIKSKFSLDFYGCIKLVNYIRSERKDGRAVSADISQTDFEIDKYLIPVLQDDALLFNLGDLPDVISNGKITHEEPGPCHETARLLACVADLEAELQKTQSQFLNYRETVVRTLDERWNDGLLTQSTLDGAAAEEKRDDDSHYFSSYSYNDIHETMLKDTVRTNAYRDFIYDHKHLFNSKVVLDVGCGTGILSLFCAKAGAAQVFAVDNSAIIDKARENVYNNGFSDKITCLRGKIEEVTLPVEKVDIIVSEWMGYCLLYEAMLDSVIWARDKYLRKGGLMVPSHMNMWLGPLSDPDFVFEHFAFWRDVYGFDMKAMQAGIYDDSQVLHMPTTSLCGKPYPFHQLNLHSTTVKDLTFKIPWKSAMIRDVDMLDGFLIWFDAFFMPSRDDHVPQEAKAEEWAQQERKGIAFTTGPRGRETHWRQGVLFVDNTTDGGRFKKEEIISGDLEYTVPNENSRGLDISLSWMSDSGTKLKMQSWKLK